MIKKITHINIEDDPIRPELDLKWRTINGREIYGLFNTFDKLQAVVCIARMTDIPTDIYHLRGQTVASGSIFVAYTLWSYEKGCGSKLIAKLRKEAILMKARRLVTLSPLTDMARNFHLKNGAIELATNKKSRNFEYKLLQSD